MQTLDVINKCLATMGETALNSLSDPHSFKGDAIAALDRARKKLLAAGWHFNTEYLKLSPSVVDSNVYLPGDYLAARATDEWKMPDPAITVRGRRLYKLDGGSYVFTSPVYVTLIRDVPFEDLSEVVASYVASDAIVQFQQDFDGDSTKNRSLQTERDIARTIAKAEDIRSRRVNMLDNSLPLARIRRGVYNSRRG